MLSSNLFSQQTLFQACTRAKHSSVSATTLVINNIVSVIHRGKFCAALFVDITKASHTVDHTVLQGLSDVGFGDLSLIWFCDFLSNRQQCVGLMNVLSPYLTLSKGVTQDSVLGPVLSTRHIHDITSAVHSVTPTCTLMTVLYCFINTARLATEILKQASQTKKYTLQSKINLNLD